MKRLIGIDALSLSLGISCASVRWHVRNGRIPVVRIGRTVRFDLEDVLAALKNQNRKDLDGLRTESQINKQPLIFDNLMVERALGLSRRERK